MENVQPNEKNFNLTKVKCLPNGGLQVVYQMNENVDGEPSVSDYTATINRDIHADLRELFEDLRPVVARVFNITSFLTLLESKEMQLSDAKKKMAREYAEELVNKIDVRGVTWSGSGEGIGVIITSVFETPNGLKTCINTPRIKMSQISFGFEEELEVIVENIKSEVYQFLFNGKSAQLSLFGDNGEESKDMPDNG